MYGKEERGEKGCGLVGRGDRVCGREGINMMMTVRGYKRLAMSFPSCVLRVVFWGSWWPLHVFWGFSLLVFSLAVGVAPWASGLGRRVGWAVSVSSSATHQKPFTGEAS